MVHATSPNFDGPYTFANVVTVPFAHEPNAVRSPEGDWVIFMTMRHPAGGAANCTAKATSTLAAGSGHAERAALPEPRHTYMTHAKTPDGERRSAPLTPRFPPLNRFEQLALESGVFPRSVDRPGDGAKSQLLSLGQPHCVDRHKFGSHYRRGEWGSGWDLAALRKHEGNGLRRSVLHIPAPSDGMLPLPIFSLSLFICVLLSLLVLLAITVPPALPFRRLRTGKTLVSPQQDHSLAVTR